MCESNIQNISAIKRILRCFEICSGLRINFFKRKIGSIGVDKNVLGSFSEVLHCNIMNIPFLYIGLPIGGKSTKISFRDPVLTKVKKRLSMWKGKNLSFAGRVCFIRLVLNATPCIISLSSKFHHLYAKRLQSYNVSSCGVGILWEGKLLGLNGIIYVNLKRKVG